MVALPLTSAVLQCQEQCPYGRYGQGCQHQCRCENGASCDPVDGACSCPPGLWIYSGGKYFPT